MLLRPATPADHDVIAALTTAAFAGVFPDGPGGEAAIIAGVRAEGAVLVELVAETAGRIVGHVLFSRMTCDPPALVAGLGPVAVDPDLQRQGTGAALCRTGLERCRELGVAGVVVLGHPDYYPRFGFSAAAAAPLISPYAGSPAFMAMALKTSGLEGVRRVDDPAAFGWPGP